MSCVLKAILHFLSKNRESHSTNAKEITWFISEASKVMLTVTIAMRGCHQDSLIHSLQTKKKKAHSKRLVTQKASQVLQYILLSCIKVNWLNLEF